MFPSAKIYYLVVLINFVFFASSRVSRFALFSKAKNSCAVSNVFIHQRIVFTLSYCALFCLRHPNCVSFIHGRNYICSLSRYPDSISIEKSTIMKSYSIKNDKRINCFENGVEKLVHQIDLSDYCFLADRSYEANCTKIGEQILQK